MWFGKFADSVRLNEALKMRGMRLVQNLCNPEFVSAVNTPDQPYYCADDNYLHLIATLDHELDLPRCFSRADFDAAMAKCHMALDIRSSCNQIAKFDELLEYVCECIIVTGGNVSSDFSNKRLSKEAQSKGQYRFSNNPLRCEKALEQVPTPKFKQALKPISHNGQRNKSADAEQLQLYLDKLMA